MYAWLDEHPDVVSNVGHIPFSRNWPPKGHTWKKAKIRKSPINKAFLAFKQKKKDSAFRR
jgi:hypothetical protein